MRSAPTCQEWVDKGDGLTRPCPNEPLSGTRLCATHTPDAATTWREGRHWQVEFWNIAAWVGVKNDRWMLGIVFNREPLVGLGLGPVYVGIGARYDR